MLVLTQAWHSLSTEIKLWQVLRDRNPLPAYTKGRAVLVGDAAHAMTPHQGQGATQAVENGDGFRLFQGPNATPENVQATLAKFDCVRRPRASQIQDNTRQAAARKSAEDVMRFEKFNWSYGGALETLKLVESRGGRNPSLSKISNSAA